jgi:hypothetical protein
MTCPYAQDDGAYVLGALAPADRTAFERHLGHCSSCRESVAALAVLPGLLRRLDPAAAISIGANRPRVPERVLDRTLHVVTQHRRRQRLSRRRRVGFSIMAAAMLMVLVGLGVRAVDSPHMAPSAAMTSMRPVSDNLPVTAEIGLVPLPANGGTSIVMTCRYDSRYPGSWLVRLYVYPRGGGQRSEVGSWMAQAGKEVKFNAITALVPTSIDHIELQGDDGTRLLTWTPA